MELLYSNILPLDTEDEQETSLIVFRNRWRRQIRLKSLLDILLRHQFQNWICLQQGVICKKFALL